MSMLKRIWSRQSEPPGPPDDSSTDASVRPVLPVSSETAPAQRDTEDKDEAEDEEDTASPPGVTMKRPSKRATAAEMRGELSRLGLDSKGKRETLHRRLMTAYNQQVAAAEAARRAAMPVRPPRQPYLSYLCFDVEGTCEGGKGFDYPNEIIEFPVVLLQWAEDDASDSETAVRTRRLVTVDTFHSYVRPTWRPQLSEFCINLTGIQQATVDTSPTFPEVLIKFEQWLDSWGLRDERGELVGAMWVTDGPWDLRYVHLDDSAERRRGAEGSGASANDSDFVPKQLHITPTPTYPTYLLRRYLNIKNAVATYLSDRDKGQRVTTGRVIRTPKDKDGPRSLNIPGMLDVLELGKFDGRQHSGIDDATNIARIVTALAERDVLIEPNARLPNPKKARRWDWMGKPGEVIWNAPQGMYDGEGVRKKTVFDGAPPSSGAAEAKETDATVRRLLRDLTVS